MPRRHKWMIALALTLTLLGSAATEWVGRAAAGQETCDGEVCLIPPLTVTRAEIIEPRFAG